MISAMRVAVALAAAWLLAGGTSVSITEARSALSAQQRRDATAAASSDLEVLQVRENFYLIAGAGGHIGVQVGDDGVVVVDAGSSARADGAWPRQSAAEACAS